VEKDDKMTFTPHRDESIQQEQEATTGQGEENSDAKIEATPDEVLGSSMDEAPNPEVEMQADPKFFLEVCPGSPPCIYAPRHTSITFGKTKTTTSNAVHTNLLTM
jgi:hypothetical protein